MNRFLGEAQTTLDGVVYTLRCDFNAMAHFESTQGKPVFTALEAFEKGDLSVLDMRALAHSFLQRHHAGISVDLAGDILSADLDVLGRVISAATPEETGGGGKVEAGPGKGKAA